MRPGGNRPVSKKWAIITYSVLVAIVGGVAGYVFLVPSKFERDQQRWEEMERIRELRHMQLTGESAEREEYLQRTALAERRAESAGGGTEDSRALPDDPEDTLSSLDDSEDTLTPLDDPEDTLTPLTEIRQPSMFDGVPITMYMTPTCAECRRARSWLIYKGFKLIERDVNADAAAMSALQRITAGMKIALPVFEIGGRVVLGFDRRTIMSASR